MESRERDSILESHIEGLQMGVCTNNDIINAMRELHDPADISDYFRALVNLSKEAITSDIRHGIDTDAAKLVKNGTEIVEVAEHLAKLHIGFVYKKELDPSNEWAKYMIV